VGRLFFVKSQNPKTMNSPQPKPRVEIEAPSKEQIQAAKKMRRQQELASIQPTSETTKRQRRFGVEGVVLLLMAAGLLYFLNPLGSIAWILAAIPFLGGIIVMMKGWQ